MVLGGEMMRVIMRSLRFYYFSDFILHLRIDVILTLKFAIRDFIL